MVKELDSKFKQFVLRIIGLSDDPETLPVERNRAERNIVLREGYYRRYQEIRDDRLREQALNEFYIPKPAGKPVVNLDPKHSLVLRLAKWRDP